MLFKRGAAQNSAASGAKNRQTLSRWHGIDIWSAISRGEYALVEGLGPTKFAAVATAKRVRTANAQFA